MRTQSKCTLSLCGLFIVEIFPVPFTAIYSLTVIRRRPAWLPELVDRLYADKPGNDGQSIRDLTLVGHDPKVTKRKCTISLSIMLCIDILIPFTLPVGMYIVRRRPLWFRNVVARLYADQLLENSRSSQNSEEETRELKELLEKQLQELESHNTDYVRSIVKKIN